MKNNSFARFTRAFVISGHVADILVVSTTWNDLFYSYVGDVSIYDAKYSILSSYLGSAGSNVIPR